MRGWRVAIATGMVLCATGCGRPMAVQPAAAPAVKRSAPKPPPTPSPPARRAKPRLTLPAAKPAPGPATAAKPVKPPAPRPAPRVAPRVVKVDSLKLENALIEERAHAPLAYVLSRRSGNSEIADRAAAAVLFEAQRAKLSASFVAAVLLVENTPMDSTAESVAGAIGLMQVMPMHSGSWGCPSAELQEVEANICHGTRLLHMYLRRYRTTQAALRRYNGCVGSRVTRSCLRYPARVLRTASRIRREMLAAPVDSTPPAPAADDLGPPPPYYLRRISDAPDSSAILARAGGRPRWGLLLLSIDSTRFLAADQTPR